MTEQNPEQMIQEQGEPDAGVRTVTPEEVPTVDNGVEVSDSAEASAEPADDDDPEAPGQIAAPDLGAPGEDEPLPDDDADADDDGPDELGDDDDASDDEPEEIDDDEDDNVIVEPVATPEEPTSV